MSKELIDPYWVFENHNEAADLIEALQQQLEAAREIVNDQQDWIKRLMMELAAAQNAERCSLAQIKVMREALERIVNDNFDSYDEVAELAFAAFNQPTDDSALREMLAQERERCAVLCEEIDVAAFGSDRPAPNDCANAIRAMGSE